jgi:hypothetical protein
MVGQGKIFAEMKISQRCKKYEKMQIKCTEQSNLWGKCLFSQEDSIKLAKVKRHFPIHLEVNLKNLGAKGRAMKRAFSFHPQFRSGLKEIYKP